MILGLKPAHIDHFDNERHILPSSVFVATRKFLHNIQSVMDKGFANDPTVRWYSQAPEVFANEHHRYVELCANPAFEHRGVHATANFEGAAIWYPPSVSVSDVDYEEFKQTVQFPQRLGKLGEIAEACDQYRPAGPHWTLELIAIDPAVQNNGIGGKLMAFGLAQCDRSRLAAYLASSNSANLSFYERLGFTQISEVSEPGLPTMYPMIRQPKT